VDGQLGGDHGSLVGDELRARGWMPTQRIERAGQAHALSAIWSDLAVIAHVASFGGRSRMESGMLA
jgi:hypothetical protein